MNCLTCVGYFTLTAPDVGHALLADVQEDDGCSIKKCFYYVINALTYIPVIGALIRLIHCFATSCIARAEAPPDEIAPPKGPLLPRNIAQIDANRNARPPSIPLHGVLPPILPQNNSQQPQVRPLPNPVNVGSYASPLRKGTPLPPPLSSPAQNLENQDAFIDLADLDVFTVVPNHPAYKEYINEHPRQHSEEERELARGLFDAYMATENGKRARTMINDMGLVINMINNDRFIDWLLATKITDELEITCYAPFFAQASIKRNHYQQAIILSENQQQIVRAMFLNELKKHPNYQRKTPEEQEGMATLFLKTTWASKIIELYQGQFFSLIASAADDPGVISLPGKGKIFYASQMNAGARGFLERNEISVIVNVVGINHSTSGVVLFPDEFTYLIGNVQDEQNIDIPFEALLDQITPKIQAGKNVMIHCVEGRNHSGALMIALMMRLNNLNVLEATRQVQNSGRNVRMHPSIELQLMRWAVKENRASVEDIEAFLKQNENSEAVVASLREVASNDSKRKIELALF